MYTCTLHCVSDVLVCTGKVIFVRPHLLRPASSPDCFLMMYVAALSTRLLLVVHMMSVTLASPLHFMQIKCGNNNVELWTVSLRRPLLQHSLYILCTSVWFCKRHDVVKWWSLVHVWCD